MIIDNIIALQCNRYKNLVKPLPAYQKTILKMNHPITWEGQDKTLIFD